LAKACFRNVAPTAAPCVGVRRIVILRRTAVDYEA
jgi:hypothetical protein